MCNSTQRAYQDLNRHESVAGVGHISESILHDIRNSLAAISGAAETLMDSDLPSGRAKRLAGNIYHSSRRIQELLRDLLSAPGGGFRASELCSLRDIAVAACESLSASAEPYGTRMAVAVQPGIKLPMDRGRMERAFVNLIGNAIEAMPEGGDVVVSAEFDEGSVVVHVDDTGPGVDPEIRTILFQPFVTRGKRTGVGLDSFSPGRLSSSMAVTCG